MINKQKSAITFSTKTEPAIRSKAQQLLGIQREGGLGKYLGLPELFGRKKKDLFNSIIDRIHQRAISWSSKFLSTAGKTTMLKSVLSAMPTYTMSCFKLPTSLCKRIQSALTRFWWNASAEKRKMCWIAWSKLTLSKRDGGLGFRDIQKFNDALLAKISWRILSKPSSLLARTLMGKYCKNSPFLECHVPSSASHGWRGICIGRDLLRTNLGKAIGNGADTNVWTEPWLSLSEPLAPMGPPAQDAQNLTVADLICQDSGTWDRQKIQRLIPAYEKEILEIRPSKKGAKDKLIWLPSKTGEYIAKAGYFEASKNTDAATIQTCNLGDFNWTSQIWNIHCPPKLKFLRWKALKNALPVGANLRARGIEALGTCPHCGQVETTLHLFFHCRFAINFWNLAPFKNIFEPSRILSLRSGIEASNRLITLPPSGLVEPPLAPWIFWTIWTSRNKKIFEDRSISAEEALLQTILSAREWINAQTPLPQPSPLWQSKETWSTDTGSSQIFTDAAWKAEAGFGWIIKSHLLDSQIPNHSAANNVRSALMAEAMAMLLALQQVKSLSLNSLSIASDSQQLIKAINTSSPLMELHGIIYDILHLASDIDDVRFYSVCRNDNRIADALAKSGLAAINSLYPVLSGLIS